MRDYIERKRRTAKIFAVCLLVSLALLICVLVAWSWIEDTQIMSVPAMIFVTSLLGLVWWIAVVIYVARCHTFVSCIKWLEKKGLEQTADSIALDEPDLLRSKIYCGNKAFFSDKSRLILPYSEIAWVYIYQKNVYGITAYKLVIVYTKDGRKFTVQADVEEFKWLLEKYIFPNNMGLVVGYGTEQRKVYWQRNPKANNVAQRNKIIWGVVLMCLGVAALVIILINLHKGDIVTRCAMALGLLGSGGTLCGIGMKNWAR